MPIATATPASRSIEDALGTNLTYRKLILGAQVLSRKLETGTAAGENVGVLLPNSAGVAVVFMALQTIGRVPAMLNFSAGPVNVLAAMQAAQVKTVLTSKAFIEKGKLDKLVARHRRTGHASSIWRTCAPASVRSTRSAGCSPAPRRASRAQADDPAVILFTSGSEGTPKGVVLSHRNILANAAQALARVDANANDKVFNVLPVFHSFGLTGGMMMPLLAGIPIFMYPSPLHYRIVPELIYQTGATILFGTDTFLTGYARSAHAYDFRTLRLRARRRRSGEGPHAAGLHGALRHPHPRRLRRHRDRAGAGDEHADGQPPGHRRPAVAADGSPPRPGPRHRGGRPPVGARAQRHARLSARRKPRRAGAARRTAGTTPATSSPSMPPASSPSRAAPSASPRSPARWSRCRRSKPWPPTLWPQAMSVAVSIPDARKGERIVLLTTQKDAERAAMQRQAKSVGASELAVPGGYPRGRQGAAARLRQDRLCRRDQGWPKELAAPAEPVQQQNVAEQEVA